MSHSEYRTFIQAAHEGQILVGVDRVYARKLYTDVPISVIEEATGEAPYAEKLVVWFAFLASPLAIVCSAILAAFAFRWWAFLIIPVAFIWWMFNRSMSARGDSSLWLHTIIVIAAVSVHFANILPTHWMSGFAALFTFALWTDRLLYCSSTFFLRAFVLRNQRAFEAFGEGITIREEA